MTSLGKGNWNQLTQLAAVGFFLNIPLKKAGKAIGSKPWGAGMHLGALRLSNRNLHIQRPHLISQALTSWLNSDRKSIWWVIADYPVSAHCSGRKLSGPDLPGVPGASGSYFSLCRWRVGAIILSPHPTGHSLSAVIKPRSPHFQLPETSQERKGQLMLKNKSSVLFFF